jgi:hypothetical protein
MIVSILAAIGLHACPAKAWSPPTLAERAIVEQAIRYSPTARPSNKDAFALLEILRLEEHPDIAVPDEFRGMALAVSYRESRWSSRAVGDGGKAVGWTQLHKALHRACGRPDRTNPQANVRCWLWRVRRTFESKVHRRCVRREGFTERDAWIASWRWVAKGGSFPGCETGEPRLHWSQLLCWSDGERHSGVCRGRGGGWKGELSRYVARTHGERTCNETTELGVWHAHE